MADVSPLKFPCDFPIKIVGHNHEQFEREVLTIIRKHFPELTESSLGQRYSRDQSYLSITVTVNAQSQAELDALYIELTSSDYVIMAL